MLGIIWKIDWADGCNRPARSGDTSPFNTWEAIVLEQHLSANDSQMKDLVLQVVRQNPDDQLNTLRQQIFTLAAEQGLLAEEKPAQGVIGAVTFGFGPSSLSDQDFGRLIDVVWELIREGILRPGQAMPTSADHGSYNLPFYHLTEKGRNKLGMKPE